MFSFFMLLTTEGGGNWKVIDLGYEVFSAFGTVGLSVGVTQELSFLGKIIIIFTMFAGRIGLFSMAILFHGNLVLKNLQGQDKIF